MRRELLSARHAIVVAAGASVVWLTHQAIPGLLRLVPGYSGQVSEWLAVHPPMSAVTAFILFLILAAVLSLVQEAKRPRGLYASIWLGVIFGLITFDSRFRSTPPHLHDVTASVALLRSAAVIVACLVMHALKKRWLTRGLPVVPTKPKEEVSSAV